MKPTIVLTNLNHKELLKSLATSAKNSFNIYFYSPLKLAKESLLLNGILIDKKLISKTTQICVIYSFLKDIDYFKNSNYIDARNINRAITYARLLCDGKELDKLTQVLSNGEFSNKNKALLEVYTKYIKYLNDHNLTDEICIINKAIESGKHIDADYLCFKQTSLEPLELKLLSVLSDNNYSNVNINEFSNVKLNKLNNITYTNGYGSVNEVEHIINYIITNKLKYEDCVIGLIDESYINQFISIADTYNIPMSIGIGSSITNFNSYKLLVLLNRFNEAYNGTDGLKQLLYSNVFDIDKLWNNISSDLNDKDKNLIIKAIGNLRISINKDDKLSRYKSSLNNEGLKRYEYVERFANELYKGYTYLIRTYTLINNDVEYKAIDLICNYIDEYLNNIDEPNLSDVIQDLQNKSINRQLSKPGHIHITDLKGCLSCIRKDVFICGLNAKVFPGSPSEDYLLLDSDLARFNVDNVKNSINKVNQNKQLLFDVLDIQSAFNSNIHLSYAGYNLSELKDENPSSLLFEVYKKQYGNDVSINELNKQIGKQINYFDNNLSRISNIGKAYMNNKTIMPISVKNDEYTSIKLNRIISPSSGDIFFNCQKHFYLKNILGLLEPEQDDPFKDIPANDEGSLVHEAMQDLGNNPSWSKQEFLDNALNKFKVYFNTRSVIHNNNIEAETKTYMDMVSNGYDLDPHNKVYASEMKLGPYLDPITGLKFGGTVDRIEQLENGNYIIVDYKTYRNIKNEDNDIDSCFQVVLYAYLFENIEHKKVERCEYRYLRNVRTVECVYNQDIKNQLIDKLSLIKQALDSGIFECSDDENSCRYCKYGNICGKDKIEEDYNE